MPVMFGGVTLAPFCAELLKGNNLLKSGHFVVGEGLGILAILLCTHDICIFKTTMSVHTFIWWVGNKEDDVQGAHTRRNQLGIEACFIAILVASVKFVKVALSDQADFGRLASALDNSV